MRRLRLGTAPDPWGAWFADDPKQPPRRRFLDEVSPAGYQWVELGPYGSSPTDPAWVPAQRDTPGLGLDIPSPLDELARLDVDLFAIVEQNLYPCDYPCDQNIPPPIANRTARYLAGCGLGPVPTGTD